MIFLRDITWLSFYPSGTDGFLKSAAKVGKNPASIWNAASEIAHFIKYLINFTDFNLLLQQM